VDRPSVTGKFIRCTAGRLAAVVWRPPDDDPVRFAVVHVPAAFEEMNKARRTVAIQARAFAAAGGLVAAFDPTGTGDSPGDYGDATWARWRNDTQAVWEWVGRETSAPRVLWGLRLGGLVAAELAADGSIAPAVLLLWQPVASGRTYFSQFLRLASAREFAGSGEGGQDVSALRAALAAGDAVDVAGYRVNPALVGGADAVSLDTLPAPRCPVIWRESVAGATPEPSPAAAKAAERWAAAGRRIDIAAIAGPSFWAAVEIEEAPALVAATTAAVARETTAMAASAD